MPTNFFDDEEYQPWTLAQIYADLGGKDDVARALNVSPRRFSAWVANRERNRCPQRVFKVGPTSVYSISEWRDWFVRWISDHPWVDVGTLAHPSEDQKLRRFYGG